MSTSSGLTDQHKGLALKKKLLSVVESGNQQLSDTIQTFLDKPHQSEDDKVALLKAIVAIVDEVLSAGDWESSLFLRNQAKSIKAIKEEADAELRKKLGSADEAKIKEVALAADEVAVFISLFQTEGYNMEKWAVQLRSLSRYVVGRPVYEKEEDVQKRIRLRAAGANEAYVVVGVKKSDVNTDPFAPKSKDQFEHPLVQLKDTAVQKGKVIAFIHQQTRYIFHDGKLITS